MTDKLPHEAIIEKWIRRYGHYNDDELIEAGDESDTIGVIMFDGFGENDDGVAENQNLWTFAVYIHKDSLTKEFKKHEQHPFAILPRPHEECCVHVWYRVMQDEVDVVTSIEDDDCTKLDRKFVIDLIHKIEERDKK